MSEDETRATIILGRGRNANDEIKSAARPANTSGLPVPRADDAICGSPMPPEGNQMAPEGPERQGAAGNQHRIRNQLGFIGQRRSDPCRSHSSASWGQSFAARGPANYRHRTDCQRNRTIVEKPS